MEQEYNYDYSERKMPTEDEWVDVLVPFEHVNFESLKKELEEKGFTGICYTGTTESGEHAFSCLPEDVGKLKAMIVRHKPEVKVDDTVMVTIPYEILCHDCRKRLEELP